MPEFKYISVEKMQNDFDIFIYEHFLNIIFGGYIIN